MHRKSVFMRPPCSLALEAERRSRRGGMMVQTARPFGPIAPPVAPHGVPARRNGRSRRRQAALGQFAFQNFLRHRDEGPLVGGDLEKFAVRHGGVVCPKCLFLASHWAPPEGSVIAGKTGLADSAVTPATKRTGRRDKMMTPRSTRQRIMPTLLSDSYVRNHFSVKPGRVSRVGEGLAVHREAEPKILPRLIPRKTVI